MSEETKERKADSQRIAYMNDRIQQGHDYKSMTDRQIEKSMTRVYSIRPKISTIVSAYDCLESYGGSVEGRGVGAVINAVLEACMDSLRRDGLIPLKTADEIEEKFADITGEKLRRPVVQELTAPSFSRNLDIRQISEQIADQYNEEEQEEPDTEVYEPKKFSIGEVPTEKPLEDRVFERTKDDLVKEASTSDDRGAKDALLRTYKTLPESLWGSDTARTLYNANLSSKGNND